MAVLLMPGFAIGVWHRSVGVRVVATLALLPAGFSCLAENWRRSLLVIDSRHPPEIVPGLPSDSGASIVVVLHRLRNDEAIFNRVIFGIALPFWFLPALFYRWSLKSTCWFYLPLIFLAWPRRGGEARDREVIDLLRARRLEVLRRYLAIFVLAGTVVCSGVAWRFGESVLRVPDAPFLYHLFALNLPTMAPWQWLGVFGAVVTMIIYFDSDTADARAKAQGAPDPAQVGRLILLARLRTVASTLCLLLALGYVLLAFYGRDFGRLPECLSFLNGLYGPYLPAMGG